MPVFEGRVHKLPDHINTDYIISSRRKRDTLDPDVLKRYLMEDIDPEFAARVCPGDILVAGNNFGCGSAMEVATLVIRAAGMQVLIAKSYARTFYRNCINGGLLALEGATDSVEPHDRLRVQVDSKSATAKSTVTGREILVRPPDGLLFEIFQAGGLLPYIRKYKKFPGF
jgi:3-isopropylmalate/(R)-2-methylmalate dehydratase small subunit